MESEGSGKGRSQTRREEAVQLAVLSGLTLLTAVFALWALVLVAESVGPTETQTGRVLEQSSFERTNSVCNLGGLTEGSGCVDFNTPAGAVTGEFPNGDTWVVVDDAIGTSPNDVAGPSGSELEVTTSNLTGRVTALDNGRSFESRWTQAGSLGFIVLIIAGAFLVLVMVGLFALRRRAGQSFSQLPRLAVIGAFTAAIGLGAFGAWWATLRAYDVYLAPSSADLYGLVVAEPYDFAVDSVAAEEAGRVVEIPQEGIVVRALELAELTSDVRSAIEAEARPIVAVITEGQRGIGRLFVLRVLAEDSDGTLVESEPCGDLEFPTDVGIEDRIAAGLFCFPVDLDPTVTIRVAEGRGGFGTPIAAPLLD